LRIYANISDTQDVLDESIK